MCIRDRSVHDPDVSLPERLKMEFMFGLKTVSRFLAALVVGWSIFAAADSIAAEANFFVSPAGSDAWSGTLAEPNEQQTDGPFATLPRARDAVRELRKSHSGDVVVLVRGGTYRLNETVVFGLRDSGQEKTTTTYAAYPDEIPVFSSGHAIEGWQPLATPVSGLPKEAVGKVQVADVSGRFHALFDANGLLPRARSRGFIPVSYTHLTLPTICSV